MYIKSSQSREVLIPAERSGAGRTGFKQTPAFLDLGTPRRRKGCSLQPHSNNTFYWECVTPAAYIEIKLRFLCSQQMWMCYFWRLASRTA